MKRYLIICLAVLLSVGLTATAMAQIGTGISGSAHDLRGKIPSEPAGTGQICVVCHVPHNAQVANLIWNHDPTATATFTLYTSGTLDGIPTTSGEPSGISKLCLSCHDGSTAVDAYGDVGGTTFIGTFGSPAGSLTIGAGGDLSDQHPISITYNDTDDLELNPVTSTYFNSGTIEDALEDVGGSLTIQCSSCHDVHNGPDAVGAKLLRGPLEGSQICLVCHNK